MKHSKSDVSSTTTELTSMETWVRSNTHLPDDVPEPILDLMIRLRRGEIQFAYECLNAHEYRFIVPQFLDFGPTPIVGGLVILPLQAPTHNRHRQWQVCVRGILRNG